MTNSDLYRNKAVSRTGNTRENKESNSFHVPEYEVQELEQAYEDDKMRAMGYAGYCE